MVHEKARSGDPDFDDKQPITQQGGRLVKGPDGRDVLITDSAGPVDRHTGEHVNLDGPTAADLDNRPKPGEVATKASSVQTYTVEDTALGDADHVHGEAPAPAGESADTGTPDQPAEDTTDLGAARTSTAAKVARGKTSIK